MEFSVHVDLKKAFWISGKPGDPDLVQRLHDLTVYVCPTLVHGHGHHQLFTIGWGIQYQQKDAIQPNNTPLTAIYDSRRDGIQNLAHQANFALGYTYTLEEMHTLTSVQKHPWATPGNVEKNEQKSSILDYTAALRHTPTAPVLNPKFQCQERKS